MSTSRPAERSMQSCWVPMSDADTKLLAQYEFRLSPYMAGVGRVWSRSGEAACTHVDDGYVVQRVVVGRQEAEDCLTVSPVFDTLEPALVWAKIEGWI